MPDLSDRRTHLPTLDGLRGLAAIIVVISHCANAGFLPAELGRGFGQMGVGLFYGLSGLLMGRLYLGKPLTHANLVDYIWRRAARVLPLYYAVLALGAVLLFGFGTSPYMQEGAGDVFRAAALIYGTGVLWSIPVEIQFYVVFVAIWYAAARGRLGAMFVGLLIIQGVIVAAIYLTSGLGKGLANTYTLAFWLHFFLFGTLLGHLSTKPAFMKRANARTPIVLGLSALILIAGLFTPPGIRHALGIPSTFVFVGPISGGYPLLLLLLGLLNFGALRLFAGKIWRWLGKVSFSIYLLHMPVVAAVAALADDGPVPVWAKAALVFGLTFALSALTERWIELGAQRAILRMRPGGRTARGAA
ncbi:acyltransferase [uncultured Tateyamaria sp.]|uniref:acyltransferase family protein n=1 Tax=Tateyamaria sp. 1078 TaxID=3417464 RepID=UPI00262848C8|nr:acyltransferase [uncultured Tateyamaria sp.]